MYSYFLTLNSLKTGSPWNLFMFFILFLLLIYLTYIVIEKSSLFISKIQVRIFMLCWRAAQNKEIEWCQQSGPSMWEFLGIKENVATFW